MSDARFPFSATDDILEKYDAFIFDLDGTLYDAKHFKSRVMIQRIIKHSPAEFPRILAEQYARKTMRGRYFESPDALKQERTRLLRSRARFASDKAALEWYESFVLFTAQILSRFYNARPNIKPLLRALKQNKKKIAVFSDYPFVNERLAAIGLEEETKDGTIDTPVSAEELGGLKPAKEPFLKIARLLSCPPDRILLTGDREDTDGKGALLSGMHFAKIP